MKTSRALRSMWRACLAGLLAALLVLPLTASAGVTSISSGALFLRKLLSATFNDQTNSMSVGVDSSGAMHAGFSNDSTDASGYYHVYYDFCAAGLDCGTASNWSLTNLMTISSTTTILDDDQLAVDAAGHPRIVIVTTDTGSPFLDHYFYGACDSACTVSGHWAFADVADETSGVNVFITSANKHFFSLDSQGRPRFVLDNGINYVYELCNSACTTPASWTSVTLVGQSDTGLGFNTPALALTTTGLPRLLAPVQDQNTFVTGLVYWECNTGDCGANASSWISTTLNLSFSGSNAVYSSLRITPNGQPRFAYYGTPGAQPESLYYFSCGSACTNSGNWHFTGIGLAPTSGLNTAGQDPDLALDSQGHPRLAFRSINNTLGDGLGYALCDSNCETSASGWQASLVDANTQLNADWDRLVAGCSFSGWIGGYRSALVLDASGSPRIGYDAEHFLGGCSDAGLDGEDYTSIRFVYFPSLTQHRIYVPLAMR